MRNFSSDGDTTLFDEHDESDVNLLDVWLYYSRSAYAWLES